MTAGRDPCLPPGVVAYKRTPVFTTDTVPSALLKAHSTKDGCWALILVLEGEVLYVVDDARRPPCSLLLRPDASPGVIEPTILHRVELGAATQFQIEFYRAELREHLHAGKDMG